MIKVGVVRGGLSGEYQVSLASGASVLRELTKEPLNKKYKAIDIFIDRDNVWHLNGVPASLEKIKQEVDIIFNALHGDFGEDGVVQELLDRYGIKYTGSSSEASSLGYNKLLSKEEFNKLGIKTPRHILFPAYQKDFDGPLEDYARENAGKVFKKLPPPWIVKPLTGGSSMGIHVCKTFDSLVRAFTLGVNEKVSVLVEEFINGKEATVGVVDQFRGKDIYSFPPIEIRVPDNSTFFDSEVKYNGKSIEICPGNFSQGEKEELEILASKIHKGLGLKHYSRSDFIVSKNKGIFALEVNTLPGLTSESLLPKALDSIGSDLSFFIDHIISIKLKE